MGEDAWKQRFRAPVVGSVRSSSAAPLRLAVVSTESGSSEAWAWDLADGRRHLVSDSGSGAEEAYLTPDGEAVVWWLDPTGDERGRWLASPFAGGAPVPLLPGIADGWAGGLGMVPGVTAVALATDDEYVVVVDRGRGGPEVLLRSAAPLGVGCEWPPGEGGLSADGRLLAIRDASKTDIAHPAVRVLDLEGGRVLGEVLDPGRPVVPVAWSPIPGDGRLVVLREVGERTRPWLWEPEHGRLAELPVDLDGDVTRAWWLPDAVAILLQHELDGRHSLHRLEPPSGRTTEVARPEGVLSDVLVRPDGRLWLREEDGVRAPAWYDLAGERTLALPDASPAGRRWEPLWFANPRGQRIQGWLLRPDGKPPYPTVVSVHGGPEWHDGDGWEPTRQAYADHGYAVLTVNYRGSTGYGASFRESLRGDIGFPESEDIIAGLDAAIAAGTVDASRVFLEGWSWGGYLATLNAGTHPDRWRGVVAGIPVGDYVAAHYEAAPALRAWDLATLGGGPMDLPALYAERNPMAYVDAVRAPVLLIVGEHDSRCPMGQAMVYAHALRRRDRPVTVHLYPTGHHARDVEEQVRQVELILDFFRSCLASD